MSIQPFGKTCSFWTWGWDGLEAQKVGTQGPRACSTYATRCGSAGSSHHGSALTIDGMAGTRRASPVFRYSLQTFGWIKYLRKSFATVTFFAPFGIRPQTGPAWLGTGLPSLLSGSPIVTISS